MFKRLKEKTHFLNATCSNKYPVSYCVELCVAADAHRNARNAARQMFTKILTNFKQI